MAEKKKFYVYRVEQDREQNTVEERLVGTTLAVSAKQALSNMRFRTQDYSILTKQYGDTYIRFCVAREVA